MAQNYRTGAWQGLSIPTTGYGMMNAMGIQGAGQTDVYNAYGGNRAGLSYGRWTPDWNNADDVSKASKAYKGLMEFQQGRVSNIEPENDYRMDKNNIPGWRVSNQGISNPYHSQGLGPESYSGKYYSDMMGDQARWYEASYRKFETRSQELKGIAAAGGQDAYDEAQAAKKLLGKPFAEAASAAALLRQERGPRAGGGGGGGSSSSRQTSRAAQGERRRVASNDRTTGGGSGGTRRKRLRAANLLGQPLGGGSQSAAQVLG